MAQVWNPMRCARQIAAMPGVVGVAPFITSQVMAVSNDARGRAGLCLGRDFARRDRGGTIRC